MNIIKAIKFEINLFKLKRLIKLRLSDEHGFYHLSNAIEKLEKHLFADEPKRESQIPKMSNPPKPPGCRVCAANYVKALENMVS